MKRGENLKKGKTAQTTHGMTHTPTWRSWMGMKARCDNPNAEGYHNWGGRGITYCERWEEFENFFDDMGEKPDGKSIDRIDNDGNYYKENCKWATRKEQQNNMRSNVIVEFDGLSMTIAQWAEHIGISRSRLQDRLKKWTVKEALTKPIMKQYQRFK